MVFTSLHVLWKFQVQFSLELNKQQNIKCNHFYQFSCELWYLYMKRVEIYNDFPQKYYTNREMKRKKKLKTIEHMILMDSGDMLCNFYFQSLIIHYSCLLIHFILFCSTVDTIDFALFFALLISFCCILLITIYFLFYSG